MRSLRMSHAIVRVLLVLSLLKISMDRVQTKRLKYSIPLPNAYSNKRQSKGHEVGSSENRYHRENRRFVRAARNRGRSATTLNDVKKQSHYRHFVSKEFLSGFVATAIVSMRDWQELDPTCRRLGVVVPLLD